MHLLAENSSDLGSALPLESVEEGKSSKSQGTSSRREAQPELRPKQQKLPVN